MDELELLNTLNEIKQTKMPMTWDKLEKYLNKNFCTLLKTFLL